MPHSPKQPQNIVELIKLWPWKTIMYCLLVAILFWFMRAMNKTYTEKVVFNLQFRLDSAGWVAQTPFPQTVSLHVESKGWNLIKIWPTHNQETLIIGPLRPAPRISLSTANILQAAQKQFPNLNVQYISLDTLELRLERTSTKKVPILLLESEIPFQEGFCLKEVPQIIPDSVEVAGGESKLLLLPSYIPIRLMLKPLNKDHQEIFSLEIPKVNGLEFFQRETLVKIKVDSVNELIIPIKPPASLGSQPQGLTNLQVRVSGPKSGLDTLGPQHFQLESLPESGGKKWHLAKSVGSPFKVTLTENYD